jgi:hypothetical protein
MVYNTFYHIVLYKKVFDVNVNTVEPLIKDTAGEFQFCPL